ncbi:MAG: hypothetical protein ACTSYW_10550 [Candidatus Heimdallarchaeota archaeon]
MIPCKHEFAALGFEIIEKNKNAIKAVAALFCKKCGLFRTKILTFNMKQKDELKRSRIHEKL